MKAFIYPYKPGSASSKALADALGIKRISHKNSRFRGNEDKTIINWGASKLPEEVSKCHIINKPEAVAIASDKLKTFERINPTIKAGKRSIVPTQFIGTDQEKGQIIVLNDDHHFFQMLDNDDYVGPWPNWAPKGQHYAGYTILEPKTKPQEIIVRTPEYTSKPQVAISWLAAGFTVVERHVLNGNSGEGIVLREPEQQEDGIEVDQDCPLFVKYVPKKQEWRIHVCNGVAVDIQRKARRKDVADDQVNWKIRNHDNGFIFARNEGIECPQDVIVQAVNAVKCIGLDFGAVDVIFNDKEQKAYVLEINTAPGLSGTTLEGYAERFEAMLKGEVGVDNIVAVNAPEEPVELPKLREVRLVNLHFAAFDNLVANKVMGKPAVVVYDEYDEEVYDVDPIF